VDSAFHAILVLALAKIDTPGGGIISESHKIDKKAIVKVEFGAPRMCSGGTVLLISFHLPYITSIVVAHYVIPADPGSSPGGIKKFPMFVSGCRIRACPGLDPRAGMTFFMCIYV
jgi:hypothetical protein